MPEQRQFKISGSKADRAMECAGSLAYTDTPFNPQSEDANAGKAKHEALAFMVLGEDVPFEHISEKYRVDIGELQAAVAIGRKAWGELQRWFPNPHTEMQLEGEVTIGTADVISATIDETTLHRAASIALLDWKTGWSHDEHGYQLMAYADAARAVYGMPTSGYIYAAEVWVAHGEYEGHNFTEAELDGFRERARFQIAKRGKQFSPGGHCKFCERQNNCKARDEYIRSTTTTLVPEGNEPKELTREVLGSLYERSQLLSKALKRYEDMFRDALKEGPIPIGNGKAVALVAKQKDQVQAVEAERLLRAQGWNDVDVAEVLSATKSGIERVVSRKAAHGSAAGEMRRIVKMLSEAGAIKKIEEQQKTVIDLKENPRG